MSNVIQAIYEQGVFRPIELVNLPERTRVEFEPRVVQSAVSSFWKSQSLDELIAEQAITPVADLDELSALWPANDDPDELLEHIQRKRAARGHLPEEEHSP